MVVMADYQTLFEDPRTIDSLGASGFTEAELAGMRSAGIILLVTGSITAAMWFFTDAGFGVSSMIDWFLGLQLLRLHHSWRAWVLVRAAVGVAVGVLNVAASADVGTSPTGVLVCIGQLAYCAALFFLLYGTPSARRVLAGQCLCGVCLLLMVASHFVA
jgi:uncharacterized membrane protein YdcZ (DUF606 family)